MRGLCLVPICLLGMVVSYDFFSQRLIAAEASGDVWRTDFQAALAEAEQAGKPLLVHFYAIWCAPCSKMDRDVLKTPDVKKLLSERMIGVKIDSDRHPELIHRYGVQLLPSDLIVDPTNGRVLVELQTDAQRPMDRQQYLAFAARGDRIFQQAQAMHLADKKKQQAAIAKANTPEPASALTTSGSTTVELGEPKPLIGLDGFSPVALAKNRKWVRGVKEYTWVYQGVPYQMTTQDEWKAFRSNPEAYAPRLLGCDPVILSDTDRAVAGRTKFGAFYNDELYFFTSAENRKRFKANPQRFVKTQHVLKVDQIDRTAMLDEDIARK